MANSILMYFLIGILVGLMIALFVVVSCYSTRSFLFHDTPREKVFCREEDYFKTPSESLIGTKLFNSDILFVDSFGRLVHKRPSKYNNCIPGNDQEKIIDFPQYCMFLIGGEQKEGKLLSSSEAKATYDVLGDTITTGKNCSVAAGDIADSGIPTSRWI